MSLSHVISADLDSSPSEFPFSFIQFTPSIWDEDWSEWKYTQKNLKVYIYQGTRPVVVVLSAGERLNSRLQKAIERMEKIEGMKEVRL